MPKNVEKCCHDYLKLFGGYFKELLHREHGTPKIASFSCALLAVSRIERCVGEEDVCVRILLEFIVQECPVCCHFCCTGFSFQPAVQVRNSKRCASRSSGSSNRAFAQS